MADKRKSKSPAPSPRPAEEKPATLQDLLRPDLVAMLKAQADEMKAEEQRIREQARKQAEEERKAEQKRLENDFGHLLQNSKLDWKKYK